MEYFSHPIMVRTGLLPVAWTEMTMSVDLLRSVAICLQQPTKGSSYPLRTEQAGRKSTLSSEMSLHLQRLILYCLPVHTLRACSYQPIAGIIGHWSIRIS